MPVYAIDVELDPTQTLGQEMTIAGRKLLVVNSYIKLRNYSKIPFYIHKKKLKAYLGKKLAEYYEGDANMNDFTDEFLIDGFGTTEGQISWMWDYPADLPADLSIDFLLGEHDEPMFTRSLSVTIP
jgi:hypothetical protein